MEKLISCFRNVGLLSVEEAPGDKSKEVIESLIAAGETFEVLSNEQLKDRYPGLNFSSNYSGVLERSAGILRADKCLRVLQVTG